MVIREIEDSRYGRCAELADNRFQLLAPLDYGIRVIHFSRPGRENLFFVQPPGMTDLTTPEGWRIYGGHRLWTAPEGESCYEPDNAPVRWAAQDDTLVLTQDRGTTLPLAKQLRLRLAGKVVEVCHRLTNTGARALRLALWGITALAPGGRQELPFTQQPSAFKPDRVLALWNGADLSNPQLTFEPGLVRLNHQRLPQPMKLGLWLAGDAARYHLPMGTFCLKGETPKGSYPDGGVNYETYLCRHMVEMETLSPLYTLKPGQWREHVEHWSLE